MPRKSQASLSVVRIDAGQSRLRPPASLSEAERAAFIDIVSTTKANHFVASDMSLLCRYAEATVLAEQAARHLRDEGPVIAGRVSPWIVIQEKSVRALVSLSMRLRLAPQSRIDRKVVGGSQQPGSYYEKMKLQNDETE
jgi:phage terminase small subunit